MENPKKYYRIRVCAEVHKELCNRKMGFGTVNRYLLFGLKLRPLPFEQKQQETSEKVDISCSTTSKDTTSTSMV